MCFLSKLKGKWGERGGILLSFFIIRFEIYLLVRVNDKKQAI
jgi:hypothetical protein